MAIWKWDPPTLSTDLTDEQNAIAVMESLPRHILEAIPVSVELVNKTPTILSVYANDQQTMLYIDVE